MKRKTSTSHNEAIIRRLRKDPKFATEYLKAALEDESRILLITLRHLVQAQGIAKVAKATVPPPLPRCLVSPLASASVIAKATLA